MVEIELSELFLGLVNAVLDIDMECCTHRNGIEHGLVNVKLEFQNQLLPLTNKKLTEEPLIAWLIRKKLIAPTRIVDWEVPYPRGETTKKCDLVIQLGDSRRLWLELKLAWKAWFNCVGAPTYSNRAYATYLDGRDRTHSLWHDFEKLRNANLPSGDHRAVCLIGFDCGSSPMDKEVAAVVKRSQQLAPWGQVIERHWSDRRSRDFRINVWIWLMGAHAPARSAAQNA